MGAVGIGRDPVPSASVVVQELVERQRELLGFCGKKGPGRGMDLGIEIRVGSIKG